MSNYDPEMRGALFRNSKGDNDKRPDMRGDITINGTKYSLSAWSNVPKNGGDKFLSIKVSEFIEKTAAPETQPAASMDDDIPF